MQEIKTIQESHSKDFEKKVSEWIQEKDGVIVSSGFTLPTAHWTGTWWAILQSKNGAK